MIQRKEVLVWYAPHYEPPISFFPGVCFGKNQPVNHIETNWCLKQLMATYLTSHAISKFRHRHKTMTPRQTHHLSIALPQQCGTVKFHSL